ncbi:MAG: redoxin family protein [Alphaproteobacteria bacterium]
MPNTRRIFLGVAVVFGLGLGVAVWWLWRHPYAADPLVYRPAPDYVFNRGDAVEAQFKPSDWAGRPYLISFFASWCRPCHVEHPVLMKLARDSGLALVGVAYRDRPEDVDRMLQKMGNPYHKLLDDFSGDGAVAWGLRGVPESFIVDQSGEIVWHRVGPVTPAVVADQIMPLVADLTD